jgi:DNA processing protein
MQEEQAWYILARAGVSARAAMRLVEAYQRPEAILAASPGAWTAQARVSAAAAARLEASRLAPCDADLARLRRVGVCLLPVTAPAYPARLRAIPDPPPVLFVKGDPAALAQPAVAIVGARQASPYGRQVAGELARELAARGLVVVSGMALGTDAAAHDGCLRAGGQTVAVLGSGIDVVYPLAHAPLYERIAAAGAVVSEFPPGTPPAKHTFPIRNRIVSGLSLGVVVVEASAASGALITAAHALEQGREVFAVPGSINSTQSRGTHQLLREGAKLVETVEDILEELTGLIAVPARPAPAGPRWPTPEAPPPAPVAPPGLTPDALALWEALTAEPQAVDDLVGRLHMPAARINATLVLLELRGLVRREAGHRYRKSEG